MSKELSEFLDWEPYKKEIGLLSDDNLKKFIKIAEREFNRRCKLGGDILDGDNMFCPRCEKMVDHLICDTGYGEPVCRDCVKEINEKEE